MLSHFGVATNDYCGGSEHSEYLTVPTWVLMSSWSY
jgi:hypothetical protein